MKHNLILFFALIIALASCSSEETGPASVMTVNGENKTLAVGVIEDLGTNLQATVPYRTYALGLSDKSPQPLNYIEFEVNSMSTTRLDEGTYSYNYFAEAGDLSYIYVKHGMVYDSKGVATSGTILTQYDLDDDFDNRVTIAKSGDNKSFNISLRFVKGSNTYEVSGTFNKTLTEGYVYH